MKSIVALTFLFLCSSPQSNATPLETRDLPFEMIDNRIMIDAYLNGAGPFKMILDSNSSSLTVGLEIARQLNLPLNNPTPCNAVGATPKTCYDTHLNSATVAGFSTQVADAAVVPNEDIQKAIGFKKFDGVIGVQFFEEHILEFDFRDERIRIYLPSVDLSKRGSVVNLSADNDFSKFLAVEASIDGKPGFFAIDTGDRSNLTVFKPFSDSAHIRDQYPKFISTITGQGGNGPVHGDVLRMKKFIIGQVEYVDFPARFPIQKDFSSNKMSGSIGNGLLRHFDYIFDNPHKRLIFLKANDDSYQNYDHSGLWLTTLPHAFLISDVVQKSPAAVSGLQLNDEIIEVEGKKVVSDLLPEFRTKLADPKTRSVKIRVKRGARTFDVRLVLADLI